MKTVWFLLLVLGCSGGNGGSKGAAQSLEGHTFNVEGLEEITAMVNACQEGEDPDQIGTVEDVSMTATFFDDTYNMNVDGEIALGSWDIVDDDTILLVTTDAGTLEVDVAISESIDTVTFTLTSNWITANCAEN